MNKKLYFTLSMLFILLIALFLWPNSDVLAWSDPSCAPPGCNRPQPITVEGGTILAGNTLNVAEGADFITGDIIIDSTGIEIQGGRIEGDKGGLEYKIYWCSADEEGDVTCDEDVIYTSEVENTYLSDLTIIDDEVLVTADHTINLSGGNNAIYIDEGREGPWGYGVYVRAHKAISNETTTAINAVTPIQNGTMETWLYGEPIAVLADATAASMKGYGVKAVIDGSVWPGLLPPGDGKAAIYAVDQSGITSENGGYQTLAIKSEGNVDIMLVRSNDINDWGQHFTVRSANTAPGGGCGEDGWCNDILRIQASRETYGLDNIYMDGDLRIGGVGDVPEMGTHQICLNDPGDFSNCITEWPTGQGGGTAIFKTINVDNGTDPQADNASDILDVIDGTNINIVGSASNDSITINVDTTLTGMEEIAGIADDYLYLNGDNAYGVQVYDKLTVDGDLQVNELTANCANVTTNASKELTCGVDNVNDADSSISNEIQSLDGVLKVGASSTVDIKVGSVSLFAGEQLCINNTCLTESQLAALILLLK
ncbi:MAG: hypothetical protein ABH884_00135 [Candidatus Komeilibacteria bacterium]